MPPTRPRRKHPPAHDPAALRRMRWTAGLTQAELARRAEISKSMICEIEKGTRAITPALRLRLATALGVPAAEITGPGAAA